MSYSLNILQMTSKRNISRGDSERSSNYKALLTQYYDRDPQLRDVYGQINSITPEIELLDDLTAFDRQIDALIKKYRRVYSANVTMCRNCICVLLRSLRDCCECMWSGRSKHSLF